MAQWLFMHIPKTAGTSFRQIVLRQYRHLGGLEAVYDPTEVKSGPIRKDAPAYIGHYRFGFHEFISNECRYITFMRHPVKHAWSHYHFLIEMKKLPEEVDSFSAFLNHKYGNQLQLRFIAGIEDIDERENEVLEIAKKNLDQQFAFMAPMEQFDEALLLMKKRLDWRRAPVYHRANQRPNKPQMTSAEESLATTHLTQELELYQYLTLKYQEIKESVGLTKSDTEFFRIYNSLYRELDPLYISLKSFFKRRDSKSS